MINLIRSQSRILLIILLVIICLAFIVFYNIPSIEGMQRSTLGKIENKDVTQEDYLISRQAAGLLFSLSTGQPLPRGNEGEAFIGRQAWNRLIFLAYAKRLDVQVSNQEVIDFIRNRVPTLQKDGVFQPALYEQFMAQLSSSHNISADRFVEIIREYLIINEVQKALTASVHVSDAEVNHAYTSYFSPVKMSFATVLRSSYLSQATVTPAEIDTELASNAANPDYNIPEKRQVAYAAFRLSPEQAKLAGKERDNALRAIYVDAENLTVALLPENSKTAPDFAAAAAAHHGAAGQTESFALDEPAKPLPALPSLNQAAFQLTADQPVSSIIQTTDGFYVLKLLAVTPGKPRPAAEARAAAEQMLREEKAAALTLQEGQKLTEQIRAKLAAGTSFRQAAGELKLKVEDVPEFAPATLQSNQPVTETLARLSQQLQPGQISPFIPNADGGVIAYFAERKPVSGENLAKDRPRLVAQLESQRRGQLLNAWLQQRQTQAGYRYPSALLDDPVPQ